MNCTLVWACSYGLACSVRHAKCGCWCSWWVPVLSWEQPTSTHFPDPSLGSRSLPDVIYEGRMALLQKLFRALGVSKLACVRVFLT